MNFKNKYKKRWTDEEKNLALSIHFNSPKAYNFLRQKIKIKLPHKNSLNNWIPIKHFHVGFHKKYMHDLKNIFNKMDAKSREAVLIFDEMSIKKDLKYNIKHDELSGVEDFGFKRTQKMAKHVCVFMVRGLISNWKYVFSYYASDNSIIGDDLVNLLITNLNVAFESGLNIRSIICDQGANNRNCFKKLGVTISKPFFHYDYKRLEKKIYCMYDTVQLIKSF